MPTDSDDEDWYERRKRIDAEENRHLNVNQQYDSAEIPHIRRPLMLARNQALVIAGLGEVSTLYNEVYEGGGTYR